MRGKAVERLCLSPGFPHFWAITAVRGFVGNPIGRRLKSTLESSPAGVFELVYGCEKVDGAQWQEILVLVPQLVIELLPERDEPIQIHQFHMDV